MRSKGSVKSLENDLLKAARQATKQSGLASAGEAAMTYKDQDEKLLRDKLVSRLKEKEAQKVEHFGERIRNAKETNWIDTTDDEYYEGISDDDDVDVICIFKAN